MVNDGGWLDNHWDEYPNWQLDETYPEGHGKWGMPPLLKWTNQCGPWHLHQCYTKKPARQVECGFCGGNNFEVAQDDYWTGIRCTKCRIEMCIHDG